MHREDEYKHLAKSIGSADARNKRPINRAQWKFWPPPTCDLPINRRRSMTPTRITIDPPDRT